MRVCVICPSRDRPEDLCKAYESMIATSTGADMVAYVDEDQRRDYACLDRYNPNYDTLARQSDFPRGARLRVLIGKRVGSVASANLIAHHYRDPYTIYGMIPDDARFKTVGWDRYVIDRLSGDVPHIVAAAHNHGEPVNFPFTNRALIDVLGWYYYPDHRHHCCDTMLEMIGEGANAITYADPSEFLMEHIRLSISDPEHLYPDLLKFLAWCTNDRRAAVRKVRRAITESLPV